MSEFLLVGFGVSNQNVARVLLGLQSSVSIFDDNPPQQAIQAAKGLGLEMQSNQNQLSELLRRCDYIVPTPGLPDSHKLHELLDTLGASAPIALSELDVFAAHDSRPYLAVTGTNGKTTVTCLVEAMLKQSGISALAAGNADPIGVPICEAMGKPDPEMFVIEVSSFQLRHSKAFMPKVATWLNFAPDHLDVHASLSAYQACKSEIWQNLSDACTAVVNLDDPTVVQGLPAKAAHLTITTSAEPQAADFALVGEKLTAFGEPFLKVSQLLRQQPHDVFNALAATATATAGGADIAAAVEVLRNFKGLPHRLDLIASSGGITWYDDSKSTSPHSVISALQGINSAVLIAGGRNKGLDLNPLAHIAHKLRAVVALGEASKELQAVFGGRTAVMVAEDMDSAVQKAHQAAKQGDVVLLSPGCSSFDMYSSYKERGQDFIAKVQALLGGSS